MQMEEAEYPLSPCGDWAYRRSYSENKPQQRHGIDWEKGAQNGKICYFCPGDAGGRKSSERFYEWIVHCYPFFVESESG